MHCNKHTVKMILEYAQLLSTAHRVLDGTTERGTSKSARQKTIYRLSDHRDNVLYSATHNNHPSAVWVRQSDSNYVWLFELFCALMEEYTYRYGKVHACDRLKSYLANTPNKIPKGPFTEPTPAMPDDVKVKNNSIASYRNYYIQHKQHLASWSGKLNNRNVPNWFTSCE